MIHFYAEGLTRRKRTNGLRIFLQKLFLKKKNRLFGFPEAQEKWMEALHIEFTILRPAGKNQVYKKEALQAITGLKYRNTGLIIFLSQGY